jgi:hypothetical protein
MLVTFQLLCFRGTWNKKDREENKLVWIASKKTETKVGNLKEETKKPVFRFFEFFKNILAAFIVRF